MPCDRLLTTPKVPCRARDLVTRQAPHSTVMQRVKPAEPDDQTSHNFCRTEVFEAVAMVATNQAQASRDGAEFSKL